MDEVASKGRKSTTIGDLQDGILHTILEFMPIQDAARTSVLSKKWIPIWSTQPHLVFDPLFFQYVSNIGASAATVIYKILMQHTGNIMGFHLISSTCKLAQSVVDQFIIFVSKHGIQKLTLDMANEENYMLPNRIFTCATLTHLKLSRCFFKLPDGTQFPILVSLQLEHSKIAGHLGSEDDLNLPMLETLELRFCIGVDSVNLVSPKLDNMSIVSSYTVTFYCEPNLCNH
uniref:Ubiquitin-protein ligase n=1 Tax=Solanum tuberosum TaxID=4113 RepID=M1DSM9_SOLTU